MIVAKNIAIQNLMWVNNTNELGLFLFDEMGLLDFIFSVRGEVDVKASEETLSQLDVSTEEMSDSEKLFNDLGPYFCVSLTKDQLLQIRFSNPKELVLKNFFYQLKSDIVKKIAFPSLTNEQELDLFRKLKTILVKEEKKTIKLVKEGLCLADVPFQTPKICLEAVKTYSGSLVGHRIETEELCLTALFNQRTQDEISFPKRTEEMEALFSILKNGPVGSYRQNRYDLIRNSKKITDSPYHVLDCLYSY